MSSVFTEYIYWGSTPIAERNEAGEWSDYIFANGKRVAKADTFEDGILISGTNCSNCGTQVSAFDYPAGVPLSNYVIRAGDMLQLGQYSNDKARGGMVLFFSDGTNTAWSLLDQNSQYLNSDQITGWHWRRANLNAYVGKTINGIRYTADGGTLAGDWAMVFREVVINSADGKVSPIYTGEKTISLNAWGSAGSTRQYSIRHLQSVGWNPPTTTTYYHGDHLGSSSKLTAHGGWAVWEGNYKPYGEGVIATPQNHYLFTGKERDAESGLDYFGARYYSNVMGRFATPDWSESPMPVPYADLSDPQTLNLYGYVRNNPMTFADADGHCFWDLCVMEGGAALVVTAAVVATVAVIVSTPEGRQAVTELLVKGVQATENILNSNDNSNKGNPPPPPPSTGSETNTNTTPNPTNGDNKKEDKNNSSQGRSSKPDKQSEPGTKKDTSTQGRVDQLQDIQKAQNNTRQGKSDKPIDSTKKSEQNLDNNLKRIKNLEDAID